MSEMEIKFLSDNSEPQQKRKEKINAMKYDKDNNKPDMWWSNAYMRICLFYTHL